VSRLLLAGGSVVHLDRIEPADVLLDDGVVAAVGPGLDAPECGATLDVSGLLVAPGFIDLQINGAFGIDLADEPERLWEVGALLSRYGVAGFLPTIITSPPGTPRRAMAALADRPADFAGAEPLGLHLEGPMLNPDRRGAHDPALLRLPSPEQVEGWTRADGVALVTLAPELTGALAVVERLVEAGVVVAAGHTAATADELDRAVAAGLTYVTHLFNGMVPFGHRDPGPIGLVLADGRLTAGLIADGIHVHPIAVTAAWRALRPSRLSLVTDAVAALGRPPGRFPLGGRTVTLGDAGVRLDDGTLAGSALGLDEAVRNLIAFTGCSAAESISTVTATPARVLGLPRKGSVAPGFDADLTLLTADLRVATTFVGGREVRPASEVAAWRS
jgi:N-acetylglucosamine-6-phosphate deacetylase